jgi:hypothetical protein
MLVYVVEPQLVMFRIINKLITSIKKVIQNYWQELITSMASYYPGLKYLNSADYRPGNIYPLLKVKQPFCLRIVQVVLWILQVVFYQHFLNFYKPAVTVDGFYS